MNPAFLVLWQQKEKKKREELRKKAEENRKKAEGKK